MNIISVMNSIDGCYGTRLINKSGKKEVNDFLHLFDVWGSTGVPMKNENGDIEYWFELPFRFGTCTVEDFLSSEFFNFALHRLGVELKYE